MWAILHLLLGVFTATLRPKLHVLGMTIGQQREFKKAILCVRSITNFTSIAWYQSYTNSTVNYIRTYLLKYYKSKNIFLMYYASKKYWQRADNVSKQLGNFISQRRAVDVSLPPGQHT